MAIVAEGDLTGRRRTHRQPRPRKRQGTGFFEDLKPGNYVVHYQHGVGHYEGMVKRTIGGTRTRLPAAGLQGRRQAVRAQRSDRLTSPVRRRRGTDVASPRWRRLRQGQVTRTQRRARDRPGTGGAVPEAGQRGGLRLRTRHAVAGRDGRRLPVRRDARPAHRDRRRQGRHGAAVPDGSAAVRRRRLRQDRGGDPRRVQGDPGRQAGRRARPDDAARHSTRQHVRRPVLRLPDPRRDAQPLPDQQGSKAGDRRVSPPARSIA